MYTTFINNVEQLELLVMQCICCYRTRCINQSRDVRRWCM